MVPEQSGPMNPRATAALRENRCGADVTLSKAKAEANKAFKNAEGSVRGGMSTRMAAHYLIAVFWDLRRQIGAGKRLDKKAFEDQDAFRSWFEKKHATLGKKLQSPHLLRQHIK